MYLFFYLLCFITNLIRKNTGIVEKTGETNGAKTLLTLKILTSVNIILKLKVYSNKYTKKLRRYFLSEYLFCLKVYLELK